MTKHIEELKQRIGWLCAQCGQEDFEIALLKEEIARRQARRDTMWKEAGKLSEALIKKKR